MASSTPDLSTATAAEVFKQPLPTVRLLHRQLHTSLDEKNARLRTLVGGSYRQLLGTAEMIVDMRRDIEVVETKLGGVADGCGMAVVGRRVDALGKLGARAGHGDAERRLGRAARVKVLGGCVIAIGRLLRGREGEVRKGRRLVTTAKTLVLSRLLAKSLGDDGEDEDEEEEAVIAELKRKLGSLRRRLLRTIERAMENLDGDREELVNALCAYSLATSSGARDVVRQFLHVRGAAMSTALDIQDEGDLGEGGVQKHIIHALGLLAKTLVDVQALVPRRLADALLNLKGDHLLKDEGVRELEGLRLDICERWFGDEITYFTPYIRHDDLDGPQAVATLKGWAKKASEVFLEGFEKILDAVQNFSAVAELRTKAFEEWVAEGGKAKGFDSSVMLDGLRKVVNERMVGILEARVDKLHLVNTEVEAALGVIASGGVERQGGLWDAKLLEMGLGNGALAFKQAIVNNVHGRDNAVSRVVKSYEEWKRLVDEVATAIDQLKKQKWNDDLDSLEDEDVLEDRQRSLSQEDPEQLQSRLKANLEQAFITFHTKLEASFSTYEKSEHVGDTTIFILRVLRDLRAELPEQTDLSSFGVSLVPKMHQALATKISSETVPAYRAALRARKRVAGRALWEGEPELPIYPSPPTFKFLNSATVAMAGVGRDLWSRAAVDVLKGCMGDDLGSNMAADLKSAEKETPKTNGDRDNADDETTVEKAESEDKAVDSTAGDVVDPAVVAKDILVQTLFDTVVLRLCLSVPGTPGSKDKLVDLEKSLTKQVDLTSSSNERLTKSAQEYWKRTSLLLGPLA
ncbi:hypothetical protein VE01_04324 [Pseudogymnoascus verrucosus]|uniref:Conserved oligomeric Golgi complex subunit 1 n=1 Tax=Pseudogymnoascus verrucosus TaxID=342668 RepID=A0A1B8GNI5_9PEZI|nr:uncharacterized protein VE01_04324 [Pseudogymnoascus verrucosus]OBT97404.1 hypothetical protein VE01_04324 [Pseudogymnoascus verrucosus]